MIDRTISLLGVNRRSYGGLLVFVLGTFLAACAATELYDANAAPSPLLGGLVAFMGWLGAWALLLLGLVGFAAGATLFLTQRRLRGPHLAVGALLGMIGVSLLSGALSAGAGGSLGDLVGGPEAGAGLRWAVGGIGFLVLAMGIYGLATGLCLLPDWTGLDRSDGSRTGQELDPNLSTPRPLVGAKAGAPAATAARPPVAQPSTPPPSDPPPSSAPRAPAPSARPMRPSTAEAQPPHGQSSRAASQAALARPDAGPRPGVGQPVASRLVPRARDERPGADLAAAGAAELARSAADAQAAGGAQARAALTGGQVRPAGEGAAAAPTSGEGAGPDLFEALAGPASAGLDPDLAHDVPQGARPSILETEEEVEEWEDEDGEDDDVYGSDEDEGDVEDEEDEEDEDGEEDEEEEEYEEEDALYASDEEDELDEESDEESDEEDESDEDEEVDGEFDYDDEEDESEESEEEEEEFEEVASAEEDDSEESDEVADGDEAPSVESEEPSAAPAEPQPAVASAAPVLEPKPSPAPSAEVPPEAEAPATAAPAPKRSRRGRGAAAQASASPSATPEVEAQAPAGESPPPATPRGRRSKAAAAQLFPEAEPQVELAPQSARELPKPALEFGTDFERRVFECGNLFLDEGRVAVSMLQKRFDMDFKEATAILDELQARGLIGPYLGGKRRDILIDKDQWLAIQAGRT
jgi:hypothetical protein